MRIGCTATVAEVERCVDETTMLFTDLLGGSCADAPVTATEGTRYDTSSPAACLALNDWCSQLVLQSGRTP